LLDFENDPQKLWVSFDSETNYEQLYSNQKFGAFYRINQFILRANETDSEEDLFQPKYLEEVYLLQTSIEKATISHLNRTIGVTDLCFKPIANKGCQTTSPMDFWKVDLQRMKEDKDIKQTAKCLFNPENTEELPCFDRNGVPIIIDAVFGKQGCKDGEVQNDCTLCGKTSKALLVTFLLNNDHFMNKFSEIWEQKIFEKKVSEYNENSEEYFQRKELVPLVVERMSERSIPDQLEEMNSQNILTIAISYLLMFIYISLCMGEFSLTRSRILLSLGGILLVLLSFFCSVSIVSMMGIKLSLISAEVVPFLVLAIGVDNMFIITNTKDRMTRTYKIINIPKMLALTLAEAGPSITAASLSEFLAFIIGYLTKIPALQSFCLAAAFAVLIDYILQLTLFLAFVSLDEERSSKGFMDVFFCFRVKRNISTIPRDNEFVASEEEGDDARRVSEINRNSRDRAPYPSDISDTEADIPQGRESLRPEQKKPFSEKIIDFYIKVLYTIPFQIISVAAYLTIFAFGIVGILKLSLGLDQRVSVNEDSEIFKYFTSQLTFVDVGPPAYIIFNKVDYNNQENLVIIDELVDNVSRLSTVVPPVFSWYKDFSKFMAGTGPEWSSTCNPNYNFLKNLPFDIQVKEFLKIGVDSKCCKTYGICGEPYGMDISFDDEGKLDSSRFRFQHIALVNQTVYVDSILETKNLMNKYSDRLSQITGRDGKKPRFLVNDDLVDIDSVFPYSLFYVYFDQYLIIRGVLLENMLIALGVIFIAVQIIVNVGPALLITIFVLSTIICLIGFLFILNYSPGFVLELNAVSVVNIVMACGLCVEFIVHIVTFYLKYKKSTDSKEKTVYSLRTVGTSVFIGIITTKLIGVIVLAFAPSKIFLIYYFRMFISLIVVGFIHGFILLPLTLTYLKLDTQIIDEEEENQDEASFLIIDDKFDNKSWRSRY